MEITIDQIFIKAITAQKEGKHEEAKLLYQAILKTQPNHPVVNHNLGVIAVSLNKLTDALLLFKTATEINPNNANAYHNLGVVFKGLGEDQNAINSYQKAIEINPNNANTYHNLGVVFKNLGENQKAKDCYEKVIVINPNYTDAHNNLGIIFKNLEEIEKAKDCYEKAIEIDPNSSSAHNNLGVIFEELGEIQKAISCYEKSIKINPNYPYSHNNLGVIFKNSEAPHKAIKYFNKAIEIDPNNVIALNNLGTTFKDLELYNKALNCLERVIQIDPNNSDLINNLVDLFSFVKWKNITDGNTSNTKKIFLFLSSKKNINHSLIVRNIISFLFELKSLKQIEIVSDTKSLLLEHKIIQNLLTEELLHSILQKSLIMDMFFEKLLTKLRCEMLSFLINSKEKSLKKYSSFIISLAEQCWLNEYIYIQSENETNQVNQIKGAIENNNEINELEIALLASYIPLHSSKIITNKLLNYNSSNILFNDLINVQIKEPLQEIQLKEKIKTFDEIINPVSKNVQNQYEEHPYPRWRYDFKSSPCNFITYLNQTLAPNKINYNMKFNKPNILIAGCGTGKHIVSVTKFKNANILGVDLSLTSLSYAKRKNDELGFKNIEYLQADILQLRKLNRKFDVIESSGVLHHMKDPIAGLEVLTDILEPHGFLKLGLYSKTARQHVVKAREFIKNNNFKNTPEDIKTCRQLLIHNKDDLLLQKLTISSDFYSTSTVRDLLFHVQEHYFTLPEISTFLKNLKLEFLGFVHPYPSIKKLYLENFNNDKKKISLENWHKFEGKNPDTFDIMYQFWVRKR